MFEKFLSANSGDFRQRYEGTYGFYRDEKGTKLLAWLTSITDNVCMFTDARGLEYKLNVDAQKDIGFEFLPPKAGYFNTDKGAMLVQRVAQRQFQRGISGKNISINLLHKGMLIAQRIDFPLIERLYDKALSTKDAKALFEKGGSPSWAVSSQFCLGDTRHVWVLAETIGKYRKEGEKYIVSLNEKCLFRTELTDAFKAIGCPVEVN